MMRVILINLLLFCLPFVGYGLYLYLRRGRLAARDALTGKSFFWLVGGGIACVMGGLGLLATFQSGSPDAVYVPARYENGVLIPGRFVDPNEVEATADSESK